MNRPLVTFALLAYQQEKFIREAVRGALSQNYSPLEIVISDDCSADSTFEMINDEVAAYTGPHRIITNRNSQNMGIAENINKVFELATGEFIVMAAGDDISLPERTCRLVERWLDKDNRADLVCSFCQEIDEFGQFGCKVQTEVLALPDTSLPIHRWRCVATGACAGYSRTLFSKFGPLDSRILAEDSIFTFRAWLQSRCAVVKIPLVKYRRHDSCITEINRQIPNVQLPLKRRALRQRILDSEKARAVTWLRDWKVSGQPLSDKRVLEFQRWLKLIDCEIGAANSGRLAALRLALMSSILRGGQRRAARIFLRSVLTID